MSFHYLVFLGYLIHKLFLFSRKLLPNHFQKISFKCEVNANMELREYSNFKIYSSSTSPISQSKVVLLRYDLY